MNISLKVKKIIRSISFIVIMLAIFLIYCLCGSIDSSANISNAQIIAGLVLIIIELIAIITFHIDLEGNSYE